LEALAEEIDSHTGNIAVLTEAIEKLDAELLELGKDGTAAQDKRTDGANLYAAESKSLTDTIDAIKQAVELLETAKTTTDSLLLSQKQVKAVLALIDTRMDTRISSEQRNLLDNFADPDRERPDLEAKGDHEGHVKKYAFKSHSVIELLKELKTQFEDELLEVNKGETNAINAFELAKAARADLVAAAGKSKQVKEDEKTTAETDLAAAQQAQTDTQGDLDADSATLTNTEKDCRVKKTEWQERSATREGEREAIKAAIGILGKVSGVRTGAPSNPIPPTSPVDAGDSAPVFLQLGNPNTQKAAELLRKEARITHSKVLEKLAARVSNMREKGPFDQVINMIQKMIFHLKNEQTEEDNHKHWCDLEINKTNASIEDKNDKLTELSAKISEATSRVAVLTQEVKAAQDVVSDIVEHMKETTEIRKIGKKENALAVKDASDAQKALANAVAVLKDFYKQSGEIPKETWEFLQRAPVTLPDTPSTWDSSYTGVADADAQPAGIVTVLEKVSADFARMQSETEAQEESDQNAYQEDMKNCEIEKARRVKETEMKEQEKKRLLSKLESFEANHKGVSKEHEATVQYLEDLQHACVDGNGNSTYEDRKAARDDEITALKQAQGLLQDAFENLTKSENATNATGTFLQIRRH